MHKEQMLILGCMSAVVLSGLPPFSIRIQKGLTGCIALYYTCMPIPQSRSIYLISLTNPVLYLMFLNIYINRGKHGYYVLWHLVRPILFAFICTGIFRLNTVFKVVKKTAQMYGIVCLSSLLKIMELASYAMPLHK